MTAQNQKKPARKISKRRSSKLSKNHKSYLSYILLSGFCLLFFVCLYAYKSFTKSITFASTSSSTDIKSSEIYTIAYGVVEDISSEDPQELEKLSLIVVDKTDERVISYTIPLATEVDMPGTFGQESISKTLYFYNLNKSTYFDGHEYLRATLRNLTGYSIDKYVLVDKDVAEEATELLSSKSGASLSNILSLRSKTDLMRTNLSLAEIYEFYSLVATLPVERYMSKTFDFNTIDKEIYDLTIDSVVSREGKNVSILNGSPLAGVATFGSRVVQNMGSRVVAINNTNALYEQSYLIVDDPNSETVKEIQKAFKFKNVVLKTQNAVVNEEEVARSDIILVFGVDMASTL